MAIYDKSLKASESIINSVQSIVDQFTETNARDTSEVNPSKLLAASTPLLLQLKQSQRQLGLALGSDLASQLNSRRRQVENEALQLQNILYEKEHLLKELRSSKQLECPHLLNMAKDELDIATTDDLYDDDIDDVDDDAMEDMNQDSIIDRFLAPKNNIDNSYSHRDTARHNYNLSKMHSELTNRGTLHSQLLKAKKEKSALLQNLKLKRKFLSSIPQQILQLDKGINTLKNHFQNEDMNQSARLILKDRDEAVLELCAPLYTLHVQFDSFIRANKDRFLCDQWSIKAVSCSSTMEIMSASDQEVEVKELLEECTSKESKGLQLQIPTGNGKDMVNIDFEFLPKLNVIIAKIVPDKAVESLWAKDDLLLHDLFDKDDGRDLPLGCCADIIYRAEKDAEISVAKDEISMFDEDSDEEEQKEDAVSPAQMAVWKIRQSFQSTSKHGRPYNWCQYLAGLNHPKPHAGSKDELLGHSQIEATTKTALQTLYRRIRAHATLSVLIKKLSILPNPIPVHPSVETGSDATVTSKLVMFSLMKGAHNDSKVYNVTLKRNTKALKAQVKIYARYPAVPPEWSLQEVTVVSEPPAKKGGRELSGERNDLPLYDSNLGRIESRINSLEGRGSYYNDSDEESYDWILMHQMKRLIVEWDTLQSSFESEGEKAAVGTDTGDKRGRDRCPSALYELYKRGL